jgi:hypothetical protein
LNSPRLFDVTEVPSFRSIVVAEARCGPDRKSAKCPKLRRRVRRLEHNGVPVRVQKCSIGCSAAKSFGTVEHPVEHQWISRTSSRQGPATPTRHLKGGRRGHRSGERQTPPASRTRNREVPNARKGQIRARCTRTRRARCRRQAHGGDRPGRAPCRKKFRRNRGGITRPSFGQPLVHRGQVARALPHTRPHC